MSRFFMYGTSLEGIEQLMMASPNFSPRRSGIVPLVKKRFNYLCHYSKVGLMFMQKGGKQIRLFATLFQ